jgi:hypothetical protein
LTRKCAICARHTPGKAVIAQPAKIKSKEFQMTEEEKRKIREKVETKILALRKQNLIIDPVIADVKAKEDILIAKVMTLQEDQPCLTVRDAVDVIFQANGHDVDILIEAYERRDAQKKLTGGRDE